MLWQYLQTTEKLAERGQSDEETNCRVFALLIFLAFCPVTLAQQTAQAQDTQQTAPSVTDTQQKDI